MGFLRQINTIRQESRVRVNAHSRKREHWPDLVFLCTTSRKEGKKDTNKPIILRKKGKEMRRYLRSGMGQGREKWHGRWLSGGFDTGFKGLEGQMNTITLLLAFVHSWTTSFAVGTNVWLLPLETTCTNDAINGIDWLGLPDLPNPLWCSCSEWWCSPWT